MFLHILWTACGVLAALIVGIILAYLVMVIIGAIIAEMRKPRRRNDLRDDMTTAELDDFIRKITDEHAKRWPDR